jgi:uncharacterized protein DUF1801
MPVSSRSQRAQPKHPLPAATRASVEAARRAVKNVAPKAEEIPYQMARPASQTFMWKLFRYGVRGENVVGIGTYPKYATLFFYRGRELDDGSGLLLGGGKDMRFIRLASPADVEQAAVKRLLRQAFTLAGSPQGKKG